MKIPEFKRSKLYVGGLHVPCFVAKVKNSALPTVGQRHITKYKPDPVCEIFVRMNATAISGWPRQILEELIEAESLPVAIDEAMKEYETDETWPGYEMLLPEFRNLVRKLGPAPFITVSTIVIDDVQRQVIVVCETEIDGNLEEHGIAIHLKNQRWRFGYAEDLYDYTSSLHKALVKNLLETVLPPTKPGATKHIGVSLLYGEWEFDRAEATRLMLELKYPQSTMNICLGAFQGTRYVFSPTSFQIWERQELVENLVVVAYVQTDDTFDVQHKSNGSDDISNSLFRYLGNFLMSHTEPALIFKRAQATGGGMPHL